MRLRRAYHRSFGHGHGRFHVVAAVTIVVVAYVAVPWLSRLLDGLVSYAPAGYSAPDLAREGHARDLASTEAWTAEALLNAALVLLLAVVWFVSLRGGPRDPR